MANKNTPVQYAPTPGVKIVQDSPTKSYREPFAPAVEFDVTNAEAYGKMRTAHPNAWGEYYGGTAPTTYTMENAEKLLEAITFYNYVNAGEETITFQKAASENTYGAIDGSDAVAYGTHNTGVATYAPQAGNAAYENPEAFYDPGVYGRSLSGHGNIKRASLNGERTIGQPETNPTFYPSDYAAMNEYQTTHAKPTSPYTWGSEYATGKHRY